MGRARAKAKLKMEFISKEKLRNVTFKKRKDGLIKKLHEFTTLCDVRACMVIYGPNGSSEPEIWPQNPEEVRKIMDIYKAKTIDSFTQKSFGLSDFFHVKTKKAEEELAKLRKQNLETKYSTSPEVINNLTEAQLRGFAAALEDKVEYVKSRINFLKRNRDDKSAINNPFVQLSQPNHSFYGSLPNIDGFQEAGNFEMMMQMQSVLLMNGSNIGPYLQINNPCEGLMGEFVGASSALERGIYQVPVGMSSPYYMHCAAMSPPSHVYSSHEDQLYQGGDQMENYEYLDISPLNMISFLW